MNRNRWIVLVPVALVAAACSAREAIRLVPNVLSPDGQHLLLTENGPEGGANVRMLSLDGEAAWEPLLGSEFDERNAKLSPDGQSLVYQSNASAPGQLEARQMDKAEYHDIVNNYLLAFRTGDFSDVKWSSKLEFLSPLSGNTFKGADAVSTFLQDVTSRVSKVEILSITIDYPTASAVWQMTTTKGTLYTLNNFFRLDEEGILYIWPMFDPKAVMENPEGLVQWLTGTDY